MVGIKTSDLLIKLSKYEFYDWDKDIDYEKKYIIHFGISKDLLDQFDYPDIYDSWGYEAVNNKYANPSYSGDEWLQLENIFFRWLKNIYTIIFPSKDILVTPDLSRWWIPFEESQPKWNKRNLWIKSDYDHYISQLNNSSVINILPTEKENYRGVIIEDYNEFEILGKMATKNLDLLFFSNEDRVVKISEYLTVIIEFKNQEILETFKGKLLNSYSVQVFHI